MPSYWEFMGHLSAAFAAQGWYYVSALLSALVLMGAVALSTWVGMDLASMGHGKWNWLFIPVVLFAAGFIISLIMWSVFGSAVA